MVQVVARCKAAVAAGDELDEITCSSPEVDGDTVCATGGMAATVTVAGAVGGVETPADGDTFRRCMSRKRPFSPLLKQSFANSHRSGITFLNP